MPFIILDFFHIELMKNEKKKSLTAIIFHSHCFIVYHVAANSLLGVSEVQNNT